MGFARWWPRRADEKVRAKNCREGPPPPLPPRHLPELPPCSSLGRTRHRRVLVPDGLRDGLLRGVGPLETGPRLLCPNLPQGCQRVGQGSGALHIGGRRPMAGLSGRRSPVPGDKDGQKLRCGGKEEVYTAGTQGDICPHYPWAGGQHTPQAEPRPAAQVVPEQETPQAGSGAFWKDCCPLFWL